MSTLSDQISSRRTFAIISHPDAGKTTLTEAPALYGRHPDSRSSSQGQEAVPSPPVSTGWISKQRGISVTSSVLQFNYNGTCVDILDLRATRTSLRTPTVRSWRPAPAVMVIDGAKGVEVNRQGSLRSARCATFDATFVNKLDHDTRDPFDLMDEIETVLGIGTYPMNWPIGSGRNFRGVFDRASRHVLA